MQRIRQEKIGPSSVGGATGSTNSSGVGGTTALNQQQESSTANSSSATLPIVVIGAGAAGLMCANILKRYGLEVIVVEAQNYAGGRVKQLKGFVEWKDLDLGAEFVHGEKSILKGLIDQNGWPCRLLFTWAQGDGETPDFPVGGGISLYFLGKDKKLLRYDTDEPDVRKVNELLWNLWETKTAPGDKRTLEQYLKDNGASERCLSLAESGYANTLCSSLERLSLDGVAKLEAKWDKYGGGDYRLDNSMYQVIQHLTQDQDIRLEWPVRTINYEKDSVVLTSIHGEKIEASKVVVAVPLPVLKDEDVDFQPSLPQEKIRAIKTIGIDSAMKIVMKFSQRFWPSEVHGVICSESFLPEIWFEEPGRVGVLTPQSRPQPKQPVTLVTGNVNKNIITVITTTTTINNNTGETKTTAAVTTQPALTYLVSGFACSRNAERISQLSRQQIIDSMLSQLDTMFADKAAHKLLASDPHAPTPDPAWDETINLQKPASSTFLDCLIFDWGKQPYIKGGYSYPSPGATREVREDLARPIDDKIFFAGEATNPTSFMTLHGAMETGEFAAQAIIKSLPYASNLKKSVKPLKSKL